MSKFGKMSAIFAFLLWAPIAQAYDDDTHFYGTYAMARFAGIKHEAAERIALAAQWMDESYISDPMSMIFLPVTGVKKRRLLHFPSSREGGSLSAAVQERILSIPTNELIKTISDKIIKGSPYENDLKNIVLVSNTVENSEWASQLLIKGLKSGDLMMAAASLHVIEDSYAHAGNPAGEGHFYEWHWPDRPFHDPDKYNRMVHTVFAALVAIRSLLPDEEIDHAPGKWAYNDKLGAQELADQYFSLVKETISIDILKDKKYIQTAISDFYARAKGVHYLNADNFTPAKLKEEMDSLAYGSMDTYQALKLILTRLAEEQSAAGGKSYLDIPLILKDMGKWDAESGISIPEYIASLGPDMNPDAPGLLTNSVSFQNFVGDLVNQALLFQVPSPPSTTHVREMEDDKSIIRKTEMKIRDHNMRRFILDNFGIEVVLVPNNTSNAAGMAKEIIMDPAGEPHFLRRAPVHYATFSLAEKNRWDFMIFHYLFPSLRPEELRSMIDVQVELDKWSTYMEDRKRIQDQHLGFFNEKKALVELDYQFGVLSQAGAMAKLSARAVATIHSLRDRFFSDLLKIEKPEADSKFFQNPYEFAKYKASGKFKTLVWPVHDQISLNRP